jgi:RNA polymerase sigma factor (sigma-70 family)
MPKSSIKRKDHKYVRPAEIQKKIDTALGLPMAELEKCLEIKDRSATLYLPSECLLHLVRRAQDRDDQAMMNAVLPVLLARCAAILKVKIVEDAYRDVVELRKDILGSFAELLAENDPNKLDFFECKFLLAFRNFRIDHARPEGLWSTRVMSIPTSESEGEPGRNGKPPSKMPESLTVEPDQERSANDIALKKAILGLPEDERTAVIQVHVLDRDIEVVAKQCGCDQRTIRNRLARAAKKLKRFKEGI